MKNLGYILLLMICFCFSNCNEKKKERQNLTLEEGFKNPPQASKPRTWYHINSGNASKEGFTKDLKAIKDAGIGGVLVFNVSMGLPEGDVKYNSQEHRDILAHGAKECEKLGFKDIHIIGQNSCLGSDHEATVDGVHYNDIGFQRFADHILENMRGIIKLH